MFSAKALCGLSVFRFSMCGLCKVGTQNSGVSTLLSHRLTNTRLQFSNKIHQKRVVKRRKPAELEDPSNTRVEFDTLLYHFYTVDRYYKYVSAFAVTGTFSFLLMSDTIYRKLPKLQDDKAVGDIYNKLNLNEDRNRMIMAYTCILIAVGICSLTTLYLRRSIREMWLLKGGESVRIVTYEHFGRKRALEFPLEHVKPLQGRGKRNVHLKIKPYRVKYYLDKEGVFPNPSLYDFSAGLSRNIR